MSYFWQDKKGVSFLSKFYNFLQEFLDDEIDLPPLIHENDTTPVIFTKESSFVKVRLNNYIFRSNFFVDGEVHTVYPIVPRKTARASDIPTVTAFLRTF